MGKSLKELKCVGSGSRSIACPNCGHRVSVVLDSRPTETRCRRRRICASCDFRFTTYEAVQTETAGDILVKLQIEAVRAVNALAEALSKITIPVTLCLLLIGCHTPYPPALMSPQTRAEADALMRPKVSLLPPVSKALASRAATHLPPTNQVNVTVTWNYAPVPLYPVMIPSSNNLTAPLTSGMADFLSVIQGPTNSVRLVGLLVASTNGWRSQYPASPDMLYAQSNGVVRRMIKSEEFRAGYCFR